MLENYILTGDGEEYVDVKCVMEALGIVDEHADVLRAIRKMREEKDAKIDGLKADLKLAERVYKENRAFIDKVCEAVDIQRPYLESGYDKAVKLIAGFKRERDELKEDKDLLDELHANHISQLNDYAELAFELGIESGDAESIKDYIVSLKKERDELKEKCNKLKARTNALYGNSFGYSASKQPAVRCKVINYSWEFAPMLDSDAVPVKIELTLDANHDGSYDLEDLLRYIQNYGREKKPSEMEELYEVNDCIDELCNKHNVVQPDRKSTTKERLDYIFDVLSDYRGMHDSEWNRVEKLIKEKRAVEDSLAELRAKIREIHKSVVDDEWNNLSYTSALNDINEEYKRVVHNFEERTVDWSKTQQELDRYARLRSNICTALCLGGETSDEDILDTIAKMRDEINKRIVFRNDVAKAIGLTWTDSNSDIIKRAMQTKECHDKLYKDYAELRKAIWDAMGKKTETQPGDNASLVGEVQTLVYGNKWLNEFRDSVAEAIGMDYHTTNTFIVKRVEDIYKDWGELHDLVPNLRGEVQDLQNKYDDAESRFRFQSGLRQQWHARYESEHERANCVQKKLDKLRGIEEEKDKLEKFCKYWHDMYDSSETARGALTGKIRELKDEKTKVISALGQDIWDGAVK